MGQAERCTAGLRPHMPWRGRRIARQPFQRGVQVARNERHHALHADRARDVVSIGAMQAPSANAVGARRRPRFHRLARPRVMSGPSGMASVPCRRLRRRAGAQVELHAAQRAGEGEGHLVVAVVHRRAGILSDIEGLIPLPQGGFGGVVPAYRPSW